MVRKTNEEFQKEAKIKNKLVTVLGEYVKLADKILVECNTCHHQYFTLPAAILKGHGCRKCADKENGDRYRLKQDEFIKRMNKTNPDLEIIGEYINNSTLVKVKCLKCNAIFEVMPSNAFIRKIKCPECGNRHHADTQEEFEAKVHKVSPNIKILSDYKNGESNIKCVCLICGHEWTTRATNLKQGKGCPHCKISKGERRIESFLIDNNIDFKSQYKFKECFDINPLPFDFYLPEKNICIGFDGKQHYKQVTNWGNNKLEDTQKHDKIKNNFCKDNNIILIRIPYWDLKRIDEILTEKLLYS